jgi:hypothetical protein
MEARGSIPLPPMPLKKTGESFMWAALLRPCLQDK